MFGGNVFGAAFGDGAGSQLRNGVVVQHTGFNFGQARPGTTQAVSIQISEITRQHPFIQCRRRQCADANFEAVWHRRMTRAKCLHFPQMAETVFAARRWPR